MWNELGDRPVIHSKNVTERFPRNLWYFRTESTGDGPRLCRRPRIPLSPRRLKNRSKIDVKFDQFSVSILDRFEVVLGPQLGVIFGLFGAQVRLSSVQNASGRLFNMKNVISHQTHARVYGSAHFRAKMASKMPQDRPKTAPRGS